MSYADILKKNLPEVEVSESSLVSSVCSSMSSLDIKKECNIKEEDLKTNPNVYVCDTFDDLKNYHYKEITNDSSDDIKAVRGIIFDNGVLVRRSLPFVPEIVSTDRDAITKEMEEVDIKDIKFYNSIESSCVYLWFREKTNQWVISTHKKIDAFDSKWGNCSISFGTHFLNAVANIYETTLGYVPDDMFNLFCRNLQQGLTYAFIVSNTPDNRMVCIPMETSKLFYIGTIDNTTGEVSMDEHITDAPSFPEFFTFNTLDECIDCIDKIDYRYIQGFYCVLPNGKRFKILNSFYNELLQARGTDPSIVCRYFRVRNDKRMVDMLKYIYPEYVEMFTTFETALEASINKIHDAYIRRYFHNEHVIIPQPEFYMMQSIRKHCVDNLKDFTLDLVREFINNSEPKYVYNITKVNIKN